VPRSFGDHRGEVHVDAHRRSDGSSVIGSGNVPRQVGRGLRDLAERPRTLQVHRRLALREGEVAVAVAAAGRLVLTNCDVSWVIFSSGEEKSFANEVAESGPTSAPSPRAD
jgi:hypothetical protein